MNTKGVAMNLPSFLKPTRLLLCVALAATSAVAETAEKEKTTAEPQCYSRQDLAARAAGFIDKVYVVDGQAVKAGEVLAELDHRLLKTAVQEADAGVAAARAQLSLAE